LSRKNRRKGAAEKIRVSPSLHKSEAMVLVFR
jgi:hypothetical protein